MSATIPTATYRFQFHKDFTFRDAAALVPYLEKLGISHVYASPFFRAMPGSTHGYDICDHNALNPEVGTREEFDALVARLHEYGLGMIVDFVPNHMGIAETSNEWWMDVLENGPSSPYSRYFDIDWHPVRSGFENKVLLPVLGEQFGSVLEKGEFKVVLESGRFWLELYGQRLPLNPRSTRPLLERAVELLSAPPAELQSILTALEHLPASTETAPEKVEERQREKEVIRARLEQLCASDKEVLAAIGKALAELGAKTPESFDRLDALLENQAYRLSYWKVAAEEINYRRFFDVNTLAAIRMELPEVFEKTHQLLLELIANGSINGVRIDHIDGLANPREYLDRLQAAAAKALGGAGEKFAIYLLVEKILGPGEKLVEDWPVHGTTGYEFAGQLNEVITNEAAARAMTETYAKFISKRTDYAEIVYRSKRLVMQAVLASEVNVLGELLNRISEGNRWYRDFTLNALTIAVRELIACFPVYRTYLVPGVAPSETDVRILNRALARAKRRNRALESSVFEFLRDVLLPPEPNAHPVDEALRAQFVLKFQQCTGPITAKGVEDTSFYNYNRLVGLNEVGGEPGEFGSGVDIFHRQNLARQQSFPHCMLTTSTHDTKRSEDVRARILALSELPKDWAHAAKHWHTLNRKHRIEIDGEFAPDENEEYLIYQTLLGSWPLEPLDEKTRPTYVARIQDYMKKALHEAKQNSSWIEPSEAWDEAVTKFVARILHPRTGRRFLESFTPLAARLAPLGAQNSLAMSVLKMAAPGVPDFYQGSELWDFSLVDPDNRRPVDYALRAERLEEITGDFALTPALENWSAGTVKLLVIRTLLQLRRERAALFGEGEYVPVPLKGAFAESAIAFERRGAGENLLVVVPRLSARVGFPAIGEKWQDTAVQPFTSGGRWRNVLTGAELQATPALSLRELLQDFPVAVLISA